MLSLTQKIIIEESFTEMKTNFPSHNLTKFITSAYSYD